MSTDPTNNPQRRVNASPQAESGSYAGTVRRLSAARRDTSRVKADPSTAPPDRRRSWRVHETDANHELAVGRTLDTVPITYGGTGGLPAPPIDLEALADALAQASGGPPPRQARIATADTTLLGRIDTLTYRLRRPTVPHHVIGDGNIGAGGDDPATESGMPVVQLRAVLLDRTTPHDVRHRAWQHVAGQILQLRGRQRAGWFLYALGLVLPGLWSRALMLAPPPNTPLKRVHRVHQLLAEEFLFALDRTDPTESYIWQRCLDAAVYETKGGATPRREARAAKAAKAGLAVPLLDPPPVFVDLEFAEWAETEGRGQQTRLHRPVRGHPYMALARLVRDTATKPAGLRLTRDDARLLAHTYIDGYTLAEAARIEGISEATARGRQWRARHLVAQLLDAHPHDDDGAGTAWDTPPIP